MKEIREDEEYERDAGDGSFFSYLTNGCFRKSRNMNKYKYVCILKLKLWWYCCIFSFGLLDVVLLSHTHAQM